MRHIQILMIFTFIPVIGWGEEKSGQKLFQVLLLSLINFKVWIVKDSIEALA